MLIVGNQTHVEASHLSGLLNFSLGFCLELQRVTVALPELLQGSHFKARNRLLQRIDSEIFLQTSFHDSWSFKFLLVLDEDFSLVFVCCAASFDCQRKTPGSI